MRSLVASCITAILFTPLSLAHILPERSNGLSYGSSEASELSSSTTTTKNTASIAIELNLSNLISDKYKGECDDEKEDCGQDLSNYEFVCRKKHFKRHQVLAAANAACPNISANPQKNVFPALHTATSYRRKGPYLEWPIKRNGRLWNKWSRSRYRLVMTTKCKVVGAVYRKKDGSYEQCTYVPEVSF